MNNCFEIRCKGLPSLCDLDSLQYVGTYHDYLNRLYGLLLHFKDGSIRTHDFTSKEEVIDLFNAIKLALKKKNSDISELKKLNYLEEILDKNLLDEIIWFPVRIQNILRNQNIVTIRDLVNKMEAEILKFPNCGATSMQVIKDALVEISTRYGVILNFRMFDEL